MHRRKIISLNKKLNEKSFFGYFDILLVIYEYLNLKDKIKLMEVSMLFYNQLGNVYSNLIEEPKKIKWVMRSRYNRNSRIFYVPVKIFCENKIGIVTKDDLKLLDIAEIPLEYKRFIKGCYDLNIVVPSVKIISAKNIVEELENSKTRNLQEVTILLKITDKRRRSYEVCYVRNNVDEKYFIKKKEGLIESVEGVYYASGIVDWSPNHRISIKDINLGNLYDILYKLSKMF